MSSAMRELWSDPEFIQIIGAVRSSGAVLIAPAPRVNGTAADHTEIASFGDTKAGYPPPRPPAADTEPQARAVNGTDAVTQPVNRNGKPSDTAAVAEANKNFAARYPNGPKQ